jgi:heme exporter protein A
VNDPQPEPLLVARKLTYERDGLPVFEAVDLELRSGGMVELLGPNGSGKTTLLRCLAGLNIDFRGELQCRAAVAYVAHRSGLNPALSAVENLGWYAALSTSDTELETKQAGTTSSADDAFREALSRVGVDHVAHAPCGQLSAGQQRRVMLARLLVDPALLWLLDEPLTALDHAGRALVGELMDGHRGAGGAVVCATHQRLDRDDTQTLELTPGASVS